MKRIGLILMVVFCVLISDGLIGCRGLIVEDTGTQIAETPYDKITSPPVRETRKEIIPERVEVISKVPQGNYPKIQLGRRLVSSVGKNTIIKLEKEARRAGLAIFINQKEMPIENQGSDGKWRWELVEPGTIFLAKFYQDPATGVKQYWPVRRAQCRNLVRGVEIRVHPMVEKITERYRETVTERYRAVNTKIDYTAGLWAGIAGLIIGGLMGAGGRWSRKKQNVDIGE